MQFDSEAIRRHRPVVMGARAMVAAAHPLASLIGLDVLRSGGNAVDAAVAVNAALNVTQPGACGIGGDLFALIYSPKEGRVRFLNGSGRSPKGADPERVYAEKAASDRGIRSVTVPGCVDAWCAMLEAYGTKGLDELLAPAIRLAEEGFPISHLMAAAIQATADRLDPHPTWLATFAPNGRAPAPGERFRQPDLAASLRLIASQGRDAFYQGPISEAIVRLSEELGGWFSGDDFADHRSEWGEPVATTYREYTVFETPPNTQGIAALIGLNILEGWPVGTYPWADPGRLHLMVEAKKLAYIERDAHVADPAFYQAPLERLLSKEYAATLRGRIDPERARIPPTQRRHGAGTTYFCIADEEGLLISCVQSLYKGFGALVVPPGTGISLHNRGSYFSADPDHPNAFLPGKRPFHTLIASMVFRGSRPELLFGTMGGDGQPQTHMQVMTNLFEYGMDIQQAIEAPRFGHAVEPGASENLLLVEKRVGRAVIDGLAARGHDVKAVGGWESRMGHAQGILIGDGVYMGGADPRGDGFALGW